MEKEVSRVSTEKEITYVLLWLLVLGSIGASFATIPPEVPVAVDKIVTIAPYGHFDIDSNRTLPTGKNLTIEVNVLEGAPAGSGYIVSFSIMDYYNYTLKMGGSPTYGSILERRFFFDLNLFWQVPADGKYYFVVENPSPFNVTARISIFWEFDWSLVIPAVLAISSVIITFATIAYGEGGWPLAPEVVELRGDLDMIPDIVTSAPQSLHYIVIIEPSEKRCGVCNKHLEENEPVLRCPHCGSTSHSDHFLDWVRTEKNCPACGKHLDESDLLGST